MLQPTLLRADHSEPLTLRFDRDTERWGVAPLTVARRRRGPRRPRQYQGFYQVVALFSGEAPSDVPNQNRSDLETR